MCVRRIGIVARATVLLAGCVTVGACGASSSSHRYPVRPPVPAGSVQALVGAPAVLARVCGELARSARFPVMCPTRWPPTLAGGQPQLGILARAQGAYLVNAFNGLDDRSPHVFHLLFGAQAKPFGASVTSIESALRVTNRYVRIPMTGGGTFVQQRPASYLASTTVHGARARVLREPPYPQGGLQGGHVIVVWNEGGHGYLVSVHGQGISTAVLTRLAAALADSTAPSEKTGSSRGRSSSS
jgi:hypothetical protein